jgi:hypothetical protein
MSHFMFLQQQPQPSLLVLSKLGSALYVSPKLSNLNGISAIWGQLIAGMYSTDDMLSWGLVSARSWIH